MKKILSLTLTILLLLNICACSGTVPSSSSVHVSAPTTAPSAAPEPLPLPTPEAEAEPEPAAPSPEGEIFLTVSEITFSLVGESEYIYAGSLPLESVSWHSEDESVISVSGGVLTAAGVGSTTVWAEFEGQQISCKAGCLAATEEELNALPEETLRSPKRMPPIVENPPLEYFDDALIMGDSISFFLFKFESTNNLLGNATFLTRGGTSLLGIQNRTYNIYYQGQDIAIEDSVAASGKQKLFLMLGQNDLGYRTIEDTIESYETIINRIREKSPDVEIYIQSLVHEWCDTGADNSRNEKIDLYNAELEVFAAEMGCNYLDIKMYIEDHCGRMAAPYNMDYGIHVNEAGCIEWMNALNAHAYIEMMGEKQ